MIPTHTANTKAEPARRAVKATRAHGPVVDSNKLDRIKVSSVDNPEIRWAASFASCGGRNAEQSSTIVYEIAPGGHLGWHTDATEETQYIIAGTGELLHGGRQVSGRSQAACSSCRPMSGTISPTPARSRCARSRSLPPPCSRKTSTT